MNKHKEEAKLHRDRADELRKIAGQLSGAKPRQFVIDLIHDYERRAVAEERLAKPSGNSDAFTTRDPGMEHDLVWAQRALEHAKEMRALAAQVADEDFRKKLLDLADQYESLCETRVNRGITKLRQTST